MSVPDPAPVPLEMDSLNSLLAGIIRDNPDQVQGWMADEPGCWGFLAGKAVTAYRGQLRRPLADPERRQVWCLLWSALEELKSPGLADIPREY